MLVRTWLSFANVGVLAAVLVVWFAHPAFAEYALYGCLGWFLLAFVLMYSSWGSRPAGTRPRPLAGAAGAAPSGVPGPSGSPAGGALASAPPLDFCIYCATSLPVGADRCPSCGHARARG
jgi:hypothetical protein